MAPSTTVAETLATPKRKTQKNVSRKRKSGTATRSTNHNKELGRRGENVAMNYLIDHGYDICERNWRCFAGEADLIVRDRHSLVFVEVKTRTNETMYFPEEAVTKDKREKYERIALTYLNDRDISNLIVRFDVIAIVVLDRNRALVRHHINAFSAG